jgi:hypothetical protein
MPLPFHVCGLANQIRTHLNRSDRTSLRATTRTTLLTVRPDHWHEVKDDYMCGESIFLRHAYTAANIHRWLQDIHMLFAYGKHRVGLTCFPHLQSLLPIMSQLDKLVMLDLFEHSRSSCRCTMYYLTDPCSRCQPCMRATLQNIPPGLKTVCTSLLVLLEPVPFLSELYDSLARLVDAFDQTRWQDMDHSLGEDDDECRWECDAYESGVFLCHADTWE